MYTLTHTHTRNAEHMILDNAEHMILDNQIDEVCKKFRVYANKAVLGDYPNDYLIDHSVMFYLVDPRGLHPKP